MGNIANIYFEVNLSNLKTQGVSHIARAKYKDGTLAFKKSIYQVFEKYSKGELPIHTYRETAVTSAIQEMLWIYKDQSSDLNIAHKRGISWWDDFTVYDGTIGVAYGEVVRKFNLIDNLLSGMVANPHSQRHILSLWDEGSNSHQDIYGGLVPCAFLSQFTIIDNGGEMLVNQHLQIR